MISMLRFRWRNFFDAFLIGEYLEGKPILPMVIEVMKKLETSVIEKSKHLDDIKSNRHRVSLYIHANK